MMSECLLKDIANISISNVDKKISSTEIPVKLCNFVDVYNSWEITNNTYDGMMDATATKREIENFRMKEGMIAITKDSETRNDIGMSAYFSCARCDVVLGYHNALIIPNENIVDGRYLNAYLNSDISRKYFYNNASGSGQRYTLTIESICNLPVFLPPYGDQREIGAFFSYVNEKIENNNCINAILGSLIKLVYDYWFLQYDFPNNDGKPYKSSGGEMVWNEWLKTSIPKNWKVESIISNSLSSQIKPGVDRFTTKIYLATADVNGINISRGEEIRFSNRKSRANMQPQEYSVWFAKMKNSNKHLFFGHSMLPIINDVILSTGFCGLKCNSEVNFEYLSSFIEYSYFENEKDLIAHGATQEAVNEDDLKLIPLVIPSVEILNKYHTLMAPLYELMGKNICENRELLRLRDFLLPLLINCQVRFKE